MHARTRKRTKEYKLFRLSNSVEIDDRDLRVEKVLQGEKGVSLLLKLAPEILKIKPFSWEGGTGSKKEEFL